MRYLRRILWSIAAGLLVLVLYPQVIPGRYRKIESLAFCGHGSQVVASCLTAYDAGIPEKGFKSDLSRVVVRADRDGTVLETIQEDYVSEYRAASNYWRRGRRCVLCHPADCDVIVCAFGGGEESAPLRLPHGGTVAVGHTVHNATISRSGQLIALSSDEFVTVIDVETATIMRKTESPGRRYYTGSLMSFTEDETGLLIGGWDSVTLLPLDSDAPSIPIPLPDDACLTDIAAAPQDTFIACTERWVKRMTLQGEVVATLANLGYESRCDVAGGGSVAAVFQEESVTVYSLESNTVQRAFEFDLRTHAGVTAAALSDDGKLIAIGDTSGAVSLFRVEDGKELWQRDFSVSNPQWIPMAVVCFVMLCCAGVWFRLRRQKMPCASQQAPLETDASE